jgi:hypothetical protein
MLGILSTCKASYRVEEDIISSRYRKKQGRKERNIF